MQADGNHRAVFRVLQLVRPCHPDDLVTEVVSGIADRHDLHVLGVFVVQFAVAGHHFGFDAREVELRACGDLVHPGHQIAEIVANDKVDAVLLEGLDRTRCAFADALKEKLDVFAGEVRVLLRTRQGELFFDDRLGQDEPGEVVAATSDRSQCAQRVETGEVRHR